MELYLVTLFGLSLIGQTHNAMEKTKMLMEFQQPHTASVANNHRLNTTSKPAGDISIYLPSDRHSWILELHCNNNTELLKSKQLQAMSTLKDQEENESLEQYKVRIETQRKELIDYVKPILEDNIKNGRLWTAGLGGGQQTYKALYTNAHPKWRAMGAQWELKN